MTVIESILHDLQGMSNRALVDVARYVHKLSESAREERTEVLRAPATRGYLLRTLRVHGASHACP